MLGKFMKAAAAVALSAVIAVSGFGSADVDAATRKQAEPFKYSVIVEDNSSEVVGEKGTINVVSFNERIELAGDDAAVKKINKALLKISNNYDPSNIFGQADSMADEAEAYAGETLYDYSCSDITYNDGKYISIAVSREWYAGGVSNSFLDGYVFDLTTGKRVYLTKVLGKSLKKIKKGVIAAIKASDEAKDLEGFDYVSIINGLKASDISFYINHEGKCIVTIPPYTFFGGWYRQFVIS